MQVTTSLSPLIKAKAGGSYGAPVIIARLMIYAHLSEPSGTSYDDAIFTEKGDHYDKIAVHSRKISSCAYSKMCDS